MSNFDRHTTINLGFFAAPAIGAIMMAVPLYWDVSRQFNGIVFWLGVATLLCSILAVALEFYAEKRSKLRMLWPFLVMSAGIFVFCAGACWYFWPSQQSAEADKPGTPANKIEKYTFIVHSKFLDATKQIPNLGKSISAANIIKLAYQASYDNAFALWSGGEFIILPLDSARSWFRQPDPEWSKDHRLYDDASGRELFHTPEDRDPPYGGVGNHWLRDPNGWSWIGWRKWHCSLDDSQINFQEFENATLYGIFRKNLIQKNGQIFVLFRDGKWRAVETEYDAPSFYAPLTYEDAKRGGDSDAFIPKNKSHSTPQRVIPATSETTDKKAP